MRVFARVRVCHLQFWDLMSAAAPLKKKIRISKLKKDSFLDSQNEKNEAIREQNSPDNSLFQILLSISFFFLSVNFFSNHFQYFLR